MPLSRSMSNKRIESRSRMNPCATSNQSPNGGLVHAVLFGDVRLGSPVGNLALDGLNLSVGELGMRVLRASVVVAALLGSSIFGHAVDDVISWSAQKQVRRVAARWVVAGVADQKSIWDGSVETLVGESMRSDMAETSAHPWHCERSITVTLGSGPRPTFVSGSDIDAGEKAFERRLASS